jgi:putative endonuclease
MHYTIDVTNTYWIYIMGNQRPTLYIGMTNNLRLRAAQHKAGSIEGFTNKYKLKLLLYYEEYQSPLEAITREKSIKRWKREWKLQLIRSVNPSFKDLYSEL